MLFLSQPNLRDILIELQKLDTNTIHLRIKLWLIKDPIHSLTGFMYAYATWTTREN